MVEEVSDGRLNPPHNADPSSEFLRGPASFICLLCSSLASSSSSYSLVRYRKFIPPQRKGDQRSFYMKLPGLGTIPRPPHPAGVGPSPPPIPHLFTYTG